MCMFGANLVIPAQICDELLCGQGKVYGQTDGQTDRRTDGQTDRQMQAMTNKSQQIYMHTLWDVLHIVSQICHDHFVPGSGSNLQLPRCWRKDLKRCGYINHQNPLRKIKHQSQNKKICILHGIYWKLSTTMVELCTLRIQTRIIFDIQNFDECIILLKCNKFMEASWILLRKNLLLLPDPGG